MIKKLRLKFISIIAVIMSIILVIEIISINILTRKIGLMQSESYLSRIAQSPKYDTIDGNIIYDEDISPPPGEEPTELYFNNNEIEPQMYYYNSDSANALEIGNVYDDYDDSDDLDDDDYNEFYLYGPYDPNFPYDPFDPDNPDRFQHTEIPTETTKATTNSTKNSTKITTQTTTTKTKITTTTTKKTSISSQKSSSTSHLPNQTTKRTTLTSRSSTKSSARITTKTSATSAAATTKTTSSKSSSAAAPRTSAKKTSQSTQTTSSETETESSGSRLSSVTSNTNNSDIQAESILETTTTTKIFPLPPPDTENEKHFNNNRNSVTVDYFAIILDSNDDVYRVENLQEFSTLTKDQIAFLSDEAIKSKECSNIINNYQFYRQEKDYGHVIIFTNKSSENALMRKMMIISITVTVFAMLLLLGAAIWISSLIVKPVKDAFENQKQFISDASHELKTPLTVISANTELLEDEIGNNKWLEYIKNQTERMRSLVYDLLDLSRMDAAREPEKNFKQFSLSEAVNNAALPFESSAFEQNKNLMINIDSHILYTGNEKQIKQLTAIFIDNALKYSNDNGNIKVTLKKDHEKPVLEFYNTGCSIREDEKEKIFQRFYRSDASRTRQTGGYGLGLAIAQKIISSHKMKINVDLLENAWIKFTITM